MHSSRSIWSSIIITFSLLHTAGAQDTARACNNAASLCDQPYNNVTHLGAHNSPFVRDESTAFSSSGNHFYDSIVQLDAGVRVLSGQVHVEEPEGGAGGANLRLCHASCTLLNAGLLSDWLGEINTWLGNNPNEVVTLILVNADDASTADLAAAYQAAGIDALGYIPPTSNSIPDPWPTLGEMVDQGTRLVSFVANLAGGSDPATAPYLLDEFTYIFETPFEVTALADFTCDADRPGSVTGDAAGAIAAGMMPLMNHFLGNEQLFGIVTPDVDQVNVTNLPDENVQGSLGEHALRCTQAWGRQPAVVLVDFFNVGPAMASVDALNDVAGASVVGRKVVSEARIGEDGNTSAASAVGRSVLLVVSVLAMVGMVMV